MKINLTTLCYIENENKYLMLHRIKKANDINKNKWIGIGGHFLKDEAPEECLLREVKEETNLELISWKLRGIITFIADEQECEYMFLYTADKYKGRIIDFDLCEEGKLAWIEKEKLLSLNLWEGDRIFLKLLEENAEFFSLKLRYEKDSLIEAIKDGEAYYKKDK